MSLIPRVSVWSATIRANQLEAIYTIHSKFPLLIAITHSLNSHSLMTQSVPPHMNLTNNSPKEESKGNLSRTLQ